MVASILVFHVFQKHQLEYCISNRFFITEASKASIKKANETKANASNKAADLESNMKVNGQGLIRRGRTIKE